MASGNYENVIHKSIVNGINADISGNDPSDFANAFHSLNASINKLLNVNEMMFVFLVIRSPNGSGGTIGSPYYGYVIKASATVMLGMMHPSGYSDKRIIKFRDNTADSVATYTIIALP